MDAFKQKAEEELGVKLLSVMYLGRRQVNLRQPKDELTVRTPADLEGVNLRMPGTDAWQFLGKALGAAPTPMAFSEVYTALSTGAVDGQDNPLPTVVDAKFYEVTNQIMSDLASGRPELHRHRQRGLGWADTGTAGQGSGSRRRSG